jgi:hypothetical protein
MTVLTKVPLTFMAESTGLRTLWKRYVVDHATLERKGQKKLEYIYKRKKRKSASQKEVEQEKLRETIKEANVEKMNGREPGADGTGEEQSPAYHLIRSFHLRQGVNGAGGEAVWRDEVSLRCVVVMFTHWQYDW